jgi:hypothetical protein
MEFEPVILVGFEPRFQIGLNPFEPACFYTNLRLIVRHLTGILTDSLKRIRARIGKPRFARSGSPFKAPAPSVLDRLKGGSN